MFYERLFKTFASFIVHYLFFSFIFGRERQSVKAVACFEVIRLLLSFEFDFIICQCHCSVNVRSDRLTLVPAQPPSSLQSDNIAISIWHHIMFRLLN